MVGVVVPGSINKNNNCKKNLKKRAKVQLAQMGAPLRLASLEGRGLDPHHGALIVPISGYSIETK